MKLRDESGSLLISAIVFLMLISFFLTGVGLIIKNESRQQQLLKNNYIAKSMIQLSFNDFTSQELTEHSKATYEFNHGTVKVKALDDETIEFKAVLQNNYQFTKEMFVFIADEKKTEKEHEEALIDDSLDNEEVSESDIEDEKEGTSDKINDDSTYNESSKEVKLSPESVKLESNELEIADTEIESQPSK